VSNHSQQTWELIDAAEGQEDRIFKESLEHLHHTLRESFVLVVKSWKKLANNSSI
jgi:hypothetical protein